MRSGGRGGYRVDFYLFPSSGPCCERVAATKLCAHTHDTREVLCVVLLRLSHCHQDVVHGWGSASLLARSLNSFSSTSCIAIAEGEQRTQHRRLRIVARTLVPAQRNLSRQLRAQTLSVLLRRVTNLRCLLEIPSILAYRLAPHVFFVFYDKVRILLSLLLPSCVPFSRTSPSSPLPPLSLRRSQLSLLAGRTLGGVRLLHFPFRYDNCLTSLQSLITRTLCSGRATTMRPTATIT